MFYTSFHAQLVQHRIWPPHCFDYSPGSLGISVGSKRTGRRYPDEAADGHLSLYSTPCCIGRAAPVLITPAPANCDADLWGMDDGGPQYCRLVARLSHRVPDCASR